VKLTLNVFERRADEDKDKSWPGHMFGGRVRTSTFLLIVAFLAVWWVYDTYRPEPPPKAPVPQIVPPGFVPDPNYTWVPRSRVQQPPRESYPPTPTTTTTPPPPTVPPTTTTTTTTPPFQLPQLPCLLPAPLCPPSSTAPSSPPPLPQPSPGQ
ncbi:hypothetical protein MRAB57_169, partial [Mycobacterium rhizamassiliense]|jgi:hypothetical protein